MNLRTTVWIPAFVAAALMAAAPLWAQDQSEYKPVEVDTIVHRSTDDPVLRARFNYDRPYVISFNQRIPNARSLRKTLVQSLGSKGLLDVLVFEWFGQKQPQTLEVNIGANVPLGISQSVLGALSKERKLPLIVSLESRDGKTKDTQRIYIGMLVASGKKPIPPSKLDALLSDSISRGDFLRIAAGLE